MARDAAEAAGLPLIDIAHRDVDTPLSELGVRQAQALGAWFAALPAEQRPEVVLASPYLRAWSTAERVVDAMAATGSRPEWLADERLREKEFGQLDRLTRLGIAQQFPELAEQRQHVGKFYFRPPGGESWCDVVLRLRSVSDTLRLDHAGQRVLIVAHQVIVNCFRYVLERMTEREVLEMDAQGDVPNCAITAYRFDADAAPLGRWQAEIVNWVAPMQEAGTPVTVEPDVQAAAKP